MRRSGRPTAAPFTSPFRNAAVIISCACQSLAVSREYVVTGAGGVGGWSIAGRSAVANSFTTPRDASELYYKSSGAAPRQLTDLNHDLLAGKSIADVESLTFVSNDNRFEVEAFLD